MAFGGWHRKVSAPCSDRAHSIPHPCGLAGWYLSVVSYTIRGFSRGGHGWGAVGGKCVLVLHALMGQHPRRPRIAQTDGTRQTWQACHVQVASEKLDRGRPTGRSKGDLLPLSSAASWAARTAFPPEASLGGVVRHTIASDITLGPSSPPTPANAALH